MILSFGTTSGLVLDDTNIRDIATDTPVVYKAKYKLGTWNADSVLVNKY